MSRLQSGQYPGRQTGVALLAALILMLALVITMGNIFYRHQIDVTYILTTSFMVYNTVAKSTIHKIGTKQKDIKTL